MQNNVLLSIKPIFAERIFSGQKQYEFRKAIFRDQSVKKIFVYASAPISQVIGEFYIEDILKLSPEKLWKITNKQAGISKDYFDQYFHGRSCGYAIKIGEAIRYESPLQLKTHFKLKQAPQSFAYVPNLHTLPLYS